MKRLYIWLTFIFLYLFTVGKIIGGDIPVWSTGPLGATAVIFLYFLNEGIIFGRRPTKWQQYVGKGMSYTTLGSLPGVISLFLYASVGRMLQVVRRALRGGRIRSTPGSRFRKRTSSSALLGGVPFSIFFEEYLGTEYSMAESAVSILFFDFYTVLIAFESTFFYIIGGAAGGGCYFLCLRFLERS